ILEAMEVKTIETSLEEAQSLGVVGLFEEKYKDQVRVLKMGDYSKELCGGTHVSNTSNIGLFKIISESSIAAGVRRIEAITGQSVYEYIRNLENNMSEISDLLKAGKGNIIDRAKNLVEDLRDREKQIDLLKSKMALSMADEIISSKMDIEGISLISYKVDNLDMNGLRNLGDKIKDKLGSGVVVLASLDGDKISFVVMVTKDLVKKGVHAGNIVKDLAKATGGGGGGRPDMAQAGGKDINKLDEALSTVGNIIREQIK
ncbi:MAG: DHHA1 domain-containing protein, partial [Tissierellaceae bacterium]